MQSITYGQVTFEKMFALIKEFIAKDPDREYRITVGTDSQNFELTKTVIVVAICRVGNGGIFFYKIKRSNRINNVKQKIFYETSLSLDMALRLNKELEKDKMDCGISVHVDAGPNGLSSQVIPEIVAWVRGCGFDCKVKPESYTASSIADRISK